MEAEEDAERLLRRTEKRAFAAFKISFVLLHLGCSLVVCHMHHIFCHSGSSIVVWLNNPVNEKLVSERERKRVVKERDNREREGCEERGEREREKGLWRVEKERERLKSPDASEGCVVCLHLRCSDRPPSSVAFESQTCTKYL